MLKNVFFKKKTGYLRKGVENAIKNVKTNSNGNHKGGH